MDALRSSDESDGGGLTLRLCSEINRSQNDSSARSTIVGSAVHHQHLNESATPWGDYRHTGRHTWTTSCRALVEKNLKAGSGGGERVRGERGVRENAVRGKEGCAVPGSGRVYSRERARREGERGSGGS